MVQFLESRLKKGDQPTTDHLRQVFRRGPALVLLDGLDGPYRDRLDEVLKNKLEDVRQTIVEFRNDYALCRMAVTCRIASYERPQSDFRLDHFPDPHQITPLSPELQEWFVRAWYRELEIQHPQFQGREEAFASRLLDAIKEGELKEMAGNPFFLTAMASMNDKEKELPGNSAELMEKMVECILTESRKYQPGHNPNDEKPALAQLLAEITGGEKRLRSQLQTTAYKERIQRQNSTSRSVDIERLGDHLLLYYESKRKWVDQVVDALKQRAGLLQSKDGDTLEFAYRFEEYLAACYLADDDAWKLQSRQNGIKTPPVFARRVCDHLLTASIDASQVVKWAVGYNTHVAPGHWSDVCELVELLIVDGNPAYVQLAVDIANEAKMKDWQDKEVFGVSRVIFDLREKLETIRDDDGQIHEIRMRSRAASAIRHLGDKRPGVGIIEALPKRPDFVWCGSGGVITTRGMNAVLPKAFPPGPFLIGVPSDRKDHDEVGFPQFRCNRITHPFFFSQYPITVAQYQLFVEAGGYEEEQFWTRAGWNWRQKELVEMADWYKAEYQKESFPISAPKKYGSIFQTPNHPQVGVSWFEAKAYSNWLDYGQRRHHILEKLGLPKNCGMEVHLPTEVQWELAARWNQKKAQVDDRLYPWGNACSETELSHRCNWSKTGINGTSAVGLFPKGNADCDVADLSGNVWEWCRSKWKAPGDTWKGKPKEDEYNDAANDIDDDTGNDIRVWRGGSWIIDLPEHLRCSYRDDCAPGFRSHNIGFRCALVLVSPAAVQSRFSSRESAWSPR